MSQIAFPGPGRGRGIHSSEINADMLTRSVFVRCGDEQSRARNSILGSRSVPRGWVTTCSYGNIARIRHLTTIVNMAGLPNRTPSLHT